MMADLDEAAGQDVQEEAAEKLFGGKSDLLLAAGAEGDEVGIEGDEALIGETDAMGVAAEIAKDLIAVAERRLAVDHPAHVGELVEERIEAVGVGERGGGSDETKLSTVAGLVLSSRSVRGRRVNLDPAL